MQKVQRRIELIDDLVNGRKKLPVVKATARNGKASSNGHVARSSRSEPAKLSPFVKTARKRMTPEQRAQLDALLQNDRELLWSLHATNLLGIIS